MRGCHDSSPTSSFGLQSVHRRVQDRAVQELHHVPLQLLGLDAASFTQIGQSAADLDTMGDASTAEARSLLQFPRTTQLPRDLTFS